MTQSELNIVVRVNSRAAVAQLKSLGYEIGSVSGASRAGGSNLSSFMASLKPNLLQTFGSRLQYAGRQLTRNFTLPLVAAGAAAVKFELDNERAMTGIAKVYGTGSKQFDQVAKQELPALGKAFEALSDEFGINRAQVIGIAEDWAQAGSSGIALAKATKLTIQTMMLGENISSSAATQDLIAIQAQYGQTIDQLGNTIAILNMVNIHSGITLQGLIDGFSRAAGAARSAGVDVRHLASFLAALTPASGSATNSGNALKTIFSRLFSMTKAGAETLGLMGININTVAWQSANGTQKLLVMAKAFSKLSTAQQNVVASTIASRYQINRFDVLMRDLLNKNGYYNKSLKATADATANYRQEVFQLNTVLSSNPQRLKQIWVILQNAMADIVQPLIPLIISLAGAIAHLLQWFENLNPVIQKMIGYFLLFIAVVGPLAMMLGSIVVLFGTLQSFAKILGGVIFSLAKDMFELVDLPVDVLTGSLGGLFGIVTKGGALAVRTVVMVVSSFLRFTSIAEIVAISWGGFFAWFKGALVGLEAFTMIFVNRMKVLWLLFDGGVYTIEEAFAAVTVSAEVFMTGLKAIFAGEFLKVGEIFAAGWKALLAGAAEFGDALFAVMTGPWGILIAALLAVFVLFHKQLGQVWDNIVSGFEQNATGIENIFSPVGTFFANLVDFIVKMFYKLPQGIQSAMLDVVKIVKDAAMAVYELFSYLNPFAHHSPSLVENTQKGMKQVRGHHEETAKSAQRLYSQTAGNVRDFNKATNGVTPQLSGQYAGQRTNLAAVDPKALGSFDKLIKDLEKLTTVELKQKNAVDAQQQTMDKWTMSIDKANIKLSKQQDLLSILTDKQTLLQSKMDHSTTIEQKFASAPIQGMQAFTDALFQNQQAQDKVQLAMDKWTDQNGSIDDLTNSLDNVNGALEVSRGTLLALQAGGAGSDITSAYTSQINSLTGQQGALQNTINNSPITQLSTQLTALGNQADELNLEQDLKFGPMQNEIDSLTQSMQAMPFDKIVAGIQKQIAIQAKLKPSLDDINNKVYKQTAVVDKLNLSHDKLQKSFDLEQDKMTLLNDKYNSTSDAIGRVNDALEMLQSTVKKGKKTSSTVDATTSQFDEAAKGNFPDVGGGAKIGREGGMQSQVKQIQAFTQRELKNVQKQFGNFSLIGPFKSKISDFKNWWKGNVSSLGALIGGGLGFAIGGPMGAAIGAVLGGLILNPIKKVFKQIGNPFKGVDFMTPLHKIIDPVVNFAKGTWNAFKAIWRLLGPDVKKTFDQIVTNVIKAWHDIEPQLKAFGPTFVKIGIAIKQFWQQAEPVLKIVAFGMLALAKVFLSIIANTIGPALHTLGSIISHALMIIRGVIDLVLDLITGRWSKLGTDLMTIVNGIFGGIYAIIKGAVQIIWGFFKGLVEGIFGFFEWLYDELIGHSIVPDIVNGIITLFEILIFLPKWIWKYILDPIYQFFKSAWHDFIKPLMKLMIDGITNFWNGLEAIVKWIWNHILKPIYDLFKSTWTDYIKPAMSTIINGIQNAWGDLENLGKWIWNHVLNPIVNMFQSLWKNYLKGPLETMANDFSTIFSKIGGFIVAGINIGIKAIDKLIDGLNWIGKKIPGLSFTIPDIGTLSVPKLATGGMMASHVGNGFKTNGPRAIVGEGSPIHPEYVIPTDPRYKNNAIHLLSSLLGDMGRRGTLSRSGGSMEGVPAYGIGGTLESAAGDAWNKAKGIGKWIRGEAVTASFAPFLLAADEILKIVPNGLHEKDYLTAEKNSIYNWAKGEAKSKIKNTDYQELGSSPGVAAWSPTILSVLKMLSLPASLVSGVENIMSHEDGSGNIHVVNRTDSNWLAGHPSVGLMQTIDSIYRAYAGPYRNFKPQSYGVGLTGAGQIYAGVNYALHRYGEGMIAAGGNKNSDGSYAPYATGGIIPSLADGAYIRRRAGGVLVRVGEGSTDEVVQPVPKGLSLSAKSNEGSTYNFYGDLSFPNIKSGEDADTFISNLKALS